MMVNLVRKALLFLLSVCVYVWAGSFGEARGVATKRAGWRSFFPLHARVCPSLPLSDSLSLSFRVCSRPISYFVSLHDCSLSVIRPYTPLDGDTTGFTQLIIKKYNDGKLTPHIHNLKPGDVISMKGPIAKYPYAANTKKKLGLIAGGTGLAPMLQVIDAVLANPADKTEISFVFANIAEEDILLRKELDERAKKHKNFKVHYVLEKPPKGWSGSTGYVSKETVQKYIPAPSNDNLVMVCGPPGMMKAISGSKAPDYSQGELDGLLKDLGYTKEQVFKF